MTDEKLLTRKKGNAEVNDEKLLTQTKKLVKYERILLKQILLNLKEIEERRLYLKQGYNSMFVYCTRALGYSESAAQRRIDAMRAIKEIPEIANKIEEGRLTLSSVAMVQKTIRQEQKLKSVVIQKEKKKEIFKSIENKSSKESEKVLIKEFPQTLKSLRPDKTQRLTETQTEIRFVADETLMEKLKLITYKFSHKNVSPTYNELFQLMADQILKEPKSRVQKPKIKHPVQFQVQKQVQGQSQTQGQKQMQGQSQTQVQGQNQIHARAQKRTQVQGQSRTEAHVQSLQHIAPPQPLHYRNARYIPAATKRQVYKRDRGECQYFDPATKNRCKSKHLIQIDHRLPVAWGGGAELGNLQLLCSAHNQLKGDRILC